METSKRIWFDFTNVPHVNFLLPIMNHLSSYEQIYSLRDFAETKGLFEKKIGKPFFLVGSHKGSNKLFKVLGSAKRVVDLYRIIPGFDVKISVGGDASSIVAKLHGKTSITFDDNEKAPNWRYSRFSDLAFWPSVINKRTLNSQGFKDKILFQYNGFKEDLYLADYIPDARFKDKLPFDNYVVLRPENIQANYVNGPAGSIVPDLLKRLKDLNKNVLFLPRYSSDKELARGYKNIYVPESAINGLDACYYSDAVLTGAGTMAREAACLGIPAYSFYAGKELLTVDQKMIELGWMYFSREPKQLIDRMLVAQKRETDLNRPKKVKDQILSKIDDFLDKN